MARRDESISAVLCSRAWSSRTRSSRWSGGGAGGLPTKPTDSCSSRRTTRCAGRLAGRPRQRARRLHESPAAGCGCGLYAARDPELAVAYLPTHIKETLRARQPEILGYDVVMAIGRVSLWGRVVEAEWGWRAERGYPTELYLPARVTHYRRRGRRVSILDAEALAASLAELYVVPVRVTGSLEPRVLARAA